MDIATIRADLVKALNLISEAYGILRPYLDHIDNNTPEQPDPVDPPDPVEPPEKPSKADWECYLDRYADVAKNGPRTSAWAERHYREWGKKEGRVWGCVEEPDIKPDQKRFHHYNPRAWDERGVAVILCPGDKADSARIGNTFLKRHGNLDKGREVWAKYDTPGLIGTLEIVIGGKTYRTTISDDKEMTEGDCWRS